MCMAGFGYMGLLLILGIIPGDIGVLLFFKLPDGDRDEALEESLDDGRSEFSLLLYISSQV